MEVTIRQARREDAAVAGKICFDAFTAINAEHNFPRDFTSADVSIGLLAMLFRHPGMYAVVAEQGGRIVGSNVLDERSSIAGIGPVTVSPTVQNAGVGKALMLHVLERAAARGFPGVRLVQAAFHLRSLSLYTKLGFETREPLLCLSGPPIAARVAGYLVRPAVAADRDACNALCLAVHGHTRAGELEDAVREASAVVVEHSGRVTGYATGLAFFAHAVGETNREIEALISAATAFGGPGFLVPTRNGDLLRWCLGHGLRIVQPMTLMSRGLYSQPRGAYLPSVLY
jgi:predicted N-acetyltransferase YhbS